MGEILEGEEDEYRKLTSSQVFQLLEDHETFAPKETQVKLIYGLC